MGARSGDEAGRFESQARPRRAGATEDTLAVDPYRATACARFAEVRGPGSSIVPTGLDCFFVDDTQR